VNNRQASVLADLIIEQGGMMDDEALCRICGNTTMGEVAYRPLRARKDRYTRICIICDRLDLWINIGGTC